MSRHPEKQVAITGIGQSQVSRGAQVSALRLAVDAARAAVMDAGLTFDDIDGLVTYPGTGDGGQGFAPVGIHDLRLALGLQLQWYAAPSMESPGQMSALFAGIQAIVSRTARHVLVFRATAEASARKQARDAMTWGGAGGRVGGMWQWAVPFGAHSPAPWYAMYATRYMHDHGLTSEQLGAVAVHARRMAALNPAAVYRDPLTIEDYLASRLIASPLRLYDCDVPVDGVTAFVLSGADEAAGMPNPPLRFEAIGSAFHEGGLRRPTDMSSFGAEAAGEMMWSRTDLKPADVDVAQIYDGFSILTLHWLEALRLCGKGEAGAFVEGGARIGLDGELPMNTSGGQLSAGRLHGFGHLHEACVQLWGRGGPRQVPRDPRVAVVSNGAYGLGCLLLVKES